MLCNFGPPSLLIFSKHVPEIIYFSHIPILLVSLIVGIYLYSRNTSSLICKLILLIASVFSLWIFLDLVFWSTNTPKIIMFVWSIQILIEPMVHLLCLLLFHISVFKKPASNNLTVFLLLLYLPLVIITPTSYMIDYFAIDKCLSNETIYSYYSYIIELIYTLLIVVYSIISFKSSGRLVTINELILLSTGMIIFLVTFSWGAVVGSITDNWLVAQFGLLGMPVFFLILLYSIRKYKTIDLRILISEIIIISILIMNGSLLAIQDMRIGHPLMIATLCLTTLMSVVSLKITSRESKHLSQISSLATSLKDLNANLESRVTAQTAEIKKSYELERNAHRELIKLSETKDRFISIAQHNLRIPITSIRNKIDRIIRNIDRNDEESARLLRDTKESLNNLNEIADDFKSISRINKENNFLNLKTVSLLPVIQNILMELAVEIDKLKLDITYHTDTNSWPDIRVDRNKLKDALMVVIENAIKYNKQSGYIDISTTLKDRVLNIKIKNSGIGLTTSEKNNIETQSFYRSDRAKLTNPVGMGIGLNLAKSTIEAHHGKLEISSDGENLGATVEISIPVDFLGK